MLIQCCKRTLLGTIDGEAWEYGSAEPKSSLTAQRSGQAPNLLGVCSDKKRSNCRPSRRLLNLPAMSISSMHQMQGSLRSFRTLQQAFLKPPTNKPQRLAVLTLARKSGGRSYDGENSRRSGKGSSYENKKRRKGRPAWQRSPDDTPLRDGNRDRLMGLLTDRYELRNIPNLSCKPFLRVRAIYDLAPPRSIFRAAKTLLYYFFELNPTLYGWLSQYMKEHEIPRVRCTLLTMQ